jgi:peptidyl-tRNA hydrolase, PTH1 family
MKLIVGLGNPGLQYAKNRHNAGFQCLDYIATKHNLSFDKKNMHALWTKTKLGEHEVILAKPQTYMNLSGQSVVEILRFFKLDAKQDLLVVYDELDLPFGRIRIREKGSSGGQNGLKNIIELTGTPDIQRIRVGIGRPAVGNAKDRVLNDFDTQEAQHLEKIYERVEKAVLMWLNDGITKTMNFFNGV